MSDLRTDVFDPTLERMYQKASKELSKVRLCMVRAGCFATYCDFILRCNQPLTQKTHLKAKTFTGMGILEP